MRRRLFPIVLAFLTVGLLGSCSKVNERIDGLDKRIYDLENGKIASVDQQIAAINVSITNLKAAEETINGKITELKTAAQAQQTLIDALKEADKTLGQKDTELEARIATLEGQVTTINGQIATLEDADKAINIRIDSLRTYVDTEIGKAKSWATETFATLDQYQQTADNLAALSVTVTGISTTLTGIQTSITGLDTKINGIDAALQSKITTAKTELEGKIASLKTELEGKIADAVSASETSIKTWINGLLEGYYTIAQVDAKIGALNTAIETAKSTANERIDSVASKLTTVSDELATLKTAVDTAKSHIRTEYRNAIDVAINKLDGEIRGALKDSILAVNGRVAALDTRVTTLELKMQAVEGRLDKLEAMIQAVSIIPAYTDGSLEAFCSFLSIDCIVEPFDALTEISADSVTVLISKAKTRAAGYEAIAVSKLTKDPATGMLSIKADISSFTPAPNGMSLMAAVRICSGISHYITDFYPVYTKPNVDISEEDSDSTKVSISADADFPDAVSGILPVESSFDSTKPTTIQVEGIGTITFDEEAVEKIKENAGGATNVIIKVEDVTNTIATPVPDADVVIEVTMKTFDEAGTEVFSEDKAAGKVTVSIPLEEDVVYIRTVTLVNDNGEPITGGVIPETMVLDLEKHILSFQVEHFSKYAIGYVKQGDFVSVTDVTLNKGTLTLPISGTETLVATVAPDNATNNKVSWTSTNTSIATVDKNGKVTAVAKGEAKIIVTTEDVVKATNKPASDTCVVTVVVPVTGVSLDKTSITLAVGGTETLTATVAPDDAANKNVSWSSSDTTVATVDENGTVTAVGHGTATITVTTEDGSKTATCNLTVTTGVGFNDYENGGNI